MLDSIIPLFSDPAAWAALVTLVVMEVVLGIDNLIFISILTNKLPPERQTSARRIGIDLKPADFAYEVQTANGTVRAAGPKHVRIAFGQGKPLMISGRISARTSSVSRPGFSIKPM